MSAQVPRLPSETLERLVCAIRQAVAVSVRAISVEEASILPRNMQVQGHGEGDGQGQRQSQGWAGPSSAQGSPTTTPKDSSLYAAFAYAELSVRRVITSLKMLPDFRSLPLEQQMQLLKVRCFIVAITPTRANISISLN